MTAQDPDDDETAQSYEPDTPRRPTLGRLSQAFRDENDPDHAEAVRRNAEIGEALKPTLDRLNRQIFEPLKKLEGWPQIAGYERLADAVTMVADDPPFVDTAMLAVTPPQQAVVEQLVELVNLSREAKDAAIADRDATARTNHWLLVAAWVAAGVAVLGVAATVVIAVVTG